MTPYLPRLILFAALALTATKPAYAATAESDSVADGQAADAPASASSDATSGARHGGHAAAPKATHAKSESTKSSTAKNASAKTASAQAKASSAHAKASSAEAAADPQADSDSANPAVSPAPPAHPAHGAKAAKADKGAKAGHGAKSQARVTPQDESEAGGRPAATAEPASADQSAAGDRAAAPEPPEPPRRVAAAHGVRPVPLPPPRPDFPDDPPNASAEAREAAPGEVAPQGLYQQARLENGSTVQQYAAAPQAQPQAAWPFGGLVAPAPPPPPPAPAAEAPTPPPRPAARDAAAAPYDAAPGPAPYDARQPAEDVPGFEAARRAGLAEMTRKYANKNGIPLALLHRVIMRESKYSPHLVHKRYYGLMQITPATARSMGYRGSAQGLLDPETNLAYASAYLANAWALSGGNMDRAVQLYASGYYYTAKNKGMLDQMRDANSPPAQPSIAAPPPPPRPGNVFEAMFGGEPR